ncbi:MAG: DUF3540 domain-containing protein [Planctomycetota bacterium]
MFNASTGIEAGTTFLGPGHVTALQGNQVTVRVDEDAEVNAWLAFAFPYQPVVDDILLVIGKGETYYVIGVLHGRGNVVLTAQGDINLHAVNGKLNLSGDQGVNVAGPDIELRATNKLSLLSTSFVKKCTSAYIWVKDLLTRRSGQTNITTDGQSVNRAKGHIILSEDTVKVNGKQIHLG